MAHEQPFDALDASSSVLRVLQCSNSTFQRIVSSAAPFMIAMQCVHPSTSQEQIQLQVISVMWSLGISSAKGMPSEWSRLFYHHCLAAQIHAYVYHTDRFDRDHFLCIRKVPALLNLPDLDLFVQETLTCPCPWRHINQLQLLTGLILPKPTPTQAEIHLPVNLNELDVWLESISHDLEVQEAAAKVPECDENTDTGVQEAPPITVNMTNPLLPFRLEAVSEASGKAHKRQIVDISNFRSFPHRQ